jgi:TM2 domain-containing membrane protein YozV
MRKFLLIIFLFSGFLSKAGTIAPQLTTATDTLFIVLPSAESVDLVPAEPAKEWKGKKKFVSAMLAFPFPFGFIGAHRVMLGCKPWVPVVYVATFGGCFGLLPLIDFCVIVFSKDLASYENNPNIFMWVK